jgi:DNA-binding transcriptional MerR regulator
MNWTKNNRRLQVPAKRYRIGELVRYSPFSRQTIHNYTIMGLIREAEWTEGGHRLYDESVFGRLARILELRETMSLTEIRRVLNQEEARESAQSSRPAGLSPRQDVSLPRDGSDLYSEGEDNLADTR